MRVLRIGRFRLGARTGQCPTRPLTRVDIVVDGSPGAARTTDSKSPRGAPTSLELSMNSPRLAHGVALSALRRWQRPGRAGAAVIEWLTIRSIHPPRASVGVVRGTRPGSTRNSRRPAPSSAPPTTTAEKSPGERGVSLVHIPRTGRGTPGRGPTVARYKRFPRGLSGGAGRLPWPCHGPPFGIPRVLDCAHHDPWTS